MILVNIVFWFKCRKNIYCTEVFFFRFHPISTIGRFDADRTQLCLYEARTYSWELTYPLPFGSFESMIFLFVPCRVFQDLFRQSIPVLFYFHLNLHHKWFTFCHIPILDHQLLSVLRFHGVSTLSCWSLIFVAVPFPFKSNPTSVGFICRNQVTCNRFSTCCWYNNCLHHFQTAWNLE